MVAAEDVAVAVREHADGVSVMLRVVPRAPRTQLVGRHGDALKLKVAAPPVDGAANEAVLDHLADRCGVRPGDLEILMGAQSRQKVVLIRGLTTSEVVAALSAAGS